MLSQLPPRGEERESLSTALTSVLTTSPPCNGLQRDLGAGLRAMASVPQPALPLHTSLCNAAQLGLDWGRAVKWG